MPRDPWSGQQPAGPRVTVKATLRGTERITWPRTLEVLYLDVFHIRVFAVSYGQHAKHRPLPQPDMLRGRVAKPPPEVPTAAVVSGMRKTGSQKWVSSTSDGPPSGQSDAAGTMDYQVKRQRSILYSPNDGGPFMIVTL